MKACTLEIFFSVKTCTPFFGALDTSILMYIYNSRRMAALPKYYVGKWLTHTQDGEEIYNEVNQPDWHLIVELQTLPLRKPSIKQTTIKKGQLSNGHA